MRHCYAETFAERFRAVRGHPYEQGFDLRLVPEKLTEPLRWAKPRMIFVNSMSDLFHEGVPDGYIVKVARVMQMANWHTYQVLTKRAARMCDLLRSELRFASELTNVWWRQRRKPRSRPAPNRTPPRRAGRRALLSIEPLLENLGPMNLEGIDWVIVDGESGHGARPMEIDWVTGVRDQCQTAGISFFFKQWGGPRKGRAGRDLDGRTYDEMPDRPPSAAPPVGVRLSLISGLASERLGYAQ